MMLDDCGVLKGEGRRARSRQTDGHKWFQHFQHVKYGRMNTNKAADWKHGMESFFLCAVAVNSFLYITPPFSFGVKKNCKSWRWWVEKK
jgi:hypothetical protein